MNPTSVQDVQTDERLDQACAWIARLRSDTVSASDRRNFSSWMAQCPENREAFARMSELWGDLGALSQFPVDELYPESRVSRRPAPVRHTARRARAQRSAGGWNFNQWLAGGGLIAACLVVTLWVGNQWMTRSDQPQQIYATQVGETRTLYLADGSRVQLNTGSELRVTFSRAERRTELTRGEAYFEVAHQSARPFTVAAGKANIRVLGTEFNVARFTDDTRVSVLGGSVSVSEASAASGLRPESVKLSRNQKVSVSGTGISAVTHTSRERTLDWTQGLLVFEQTPLVDALVELNRYLKVPAQAHPSVSGRALSGTFEVSDPESALAAIAAALDLQQDRSDPNLTLLSPIPN